MATRLYASNMPSSTADDQLSTPAGHRELPASVSARARRLQLRNTGFRGPAVRRTTPKSLSGMFPSDLSAKDSPISDAENVSPSGTRVRETQRLADHDPSAALQDIGNAAGFAGPLRARRVRERGGSADLFTFESKQDLLAQEASPPTTTLHPIPNSRSVRNKVSKMSDRPRRSIGAETRRYVDHLEEELSAAQAQLQAATSPSVTREQSSTMRHMKAEVARLREEIDEWETRFDDRLREEVAKCYQVEQNLRAQLRSLEDEFEVAKYRIQELESQLCTTTEALNATETANVNMEKRIEFFSDLIASSPTKLDLHPQTPGRPLHSRLPSLLPRLPLARSPDRQASTQPTSPMQRRFSPNQPLSPRNLAYSPDVPSSEDDASQPDISGYIGHETHHPNTKRPMRRMRRFGAGSLGPKPLILPSTAQCDHVPASAPPLDSCERQFDAALDLCAREAVMNTISPGAVRRRVSTITSGSGSPVYLAGSPFPNVLDLPSSSHDLDDEARVSTIRGRICSLYKAQYLDEDDPLLRGGLDVEESTAASQAIGSKSYSLDSAIGNPVGRNLLDELEAAQTLTSAEHSSHSYARSEETETVLHASSSPFVSNASDHRPLGSPEVDTGLGSRTKATALSEQSTPMSTIVRTAHLPVLVRNPSGKTLGVQSIRTISTLDSLRDFFSDLSCKPLNLARHLIERAQARLRVPRPLLSIQWWLVGVLLGPMAKKRLIARQSDTKPRSVQGHEVASDGEPLDANDDGLDYGHLYQTPPPSSSPALGTLRSGGLVAGKGKKRASSISKGRAKHCPHHQRWKHSPILWLKFSMTLAIAVGIAFKDGPSSLLKEAMCNCKTVSCANWRRSRRDAMVSPEHA